MHKMANKFHYTIVSIENIFSLKLINIYCILITIHMHSQASSKKANKPKTTKKNLRVKI